MALITSVLTGGVNSHPTTSEEINAIATDFASQGIVGTLANTSGVAPATGGFAVNAQGTPDATVAVSAGVAWVTGTPTSQNSQMFRVKNTASQNVTISANSSGSTKYDWIYIKLDPTKLNAPNTAGDDAATLVTSRSSSSTSDDGTPPTYGYNIAVVTVANGFSTITNGNIRDTRVQTGMTTTTAAASTASWSSLGATPSSAVYNGNRNYTLTFTGNDLTDTVSPSMRIRATRTVTAPIMCTDLELSSSQYYSKSSPAGMTFTDDFVCSAWIKMESYAGAGQLSTIMSRNNGSSGWLFFIDENGKIVLSGSNAAIGNYSRITSYQSVPLGKWVHVTAQLDMSAFTATTTTSYIMIDGVDAASAVSRAGTNPTALVQAGDLQVGAYNGATGLFDGKIAQVAVFSAKVTQATMRTYMSQTLIGTETSLISAYSFNNAITDLNTSNANNLSAQGSALATSTDTPFAGGNVQEYTDGTTEMGVIVSVAFVTDTTMVVQVPEGYAMPTTGGVSAVSYSTHEIPYGFPNMNKFALSTYDSSTVTSMLNVGFVYIVENIVYTLTGAGGLSGTASLSQTGNVKTLRGLTQAFNIGSAATAGGSVNFPITYSSAPIAQGQCTANVGEADMFTYQAAVTTTTTANFTVFNTSAGGGTGTCNVSWVAIGV